MTHIRLRRTQRIHVMAQRVHVSRAYSIGNGSPGPSPIEKGGALVVELARLLFRLFVLAAFAPIAWHALMRGDWWALGFSLVSAFGLCGLLAHRHA